ncbi:MAG: hypothetical protein M1830_009198 [Pleopsidium flavum]|nr:MAG: hypothetical protein M1830_009198 [Pleopsidium flavum]
MAPQLSGFSPLRAVTQRLISTPTKHISHVAPYLAASLRDCKDVLSSPFNHGAGKDDAETAVLVHKYKNQLSTLLQEKTIEARWAAVVLIKATVEVGGWEVLRGCGVWVRGLLGLLGKPNTISTKKLSIITLTKIFLLTHEYQTLVREITTPSLPSFITCCLNIVIPKASSPESSRASAKTEILDTILDAFCHLLPRHSTLFRPFAGQLQTLLLPLIAPTPSTILPLHEHRLSSSTPRSSSRDQKDKAQRLFVLLHCCAPKSTSGEEWRKAVRTTIADTHHAAEKVFRAVIEDWETTAGVFSQVAVPESLGGIVSDGGEDLLGLPGWQGISAGIERVCGLLELLQTFLSGSTSSMVSLPLGPLMDLLTRAFSLVVPSKASDDWHGSARLNPEIGRDEREGLWVGLPHIHVAALGVLSAVAARLDESFIPLAQGALDQISWVFAAEKSNLDIRTAAYVLVAALFKLTGPSLTRSSVSSLAKIIRACCDDLLPSPMATLIATAAPASKRGSDHTKGTSSINADAFLAPPSTRNLQTLAASVGLHNAASALLPLFLSQLSPQHLSYPLRCQIDRTAVLTQHKQAMLASVLNPAPNRKGTKRISSIMPLLARSFGEVAEVEGLLRPRMPVLQPKNDADGELESDEEETHLSRVYNMETNNDGIGPTNGVREDNNLVALANTQQEPADILAPTTISQAPQLPASTDKNTDQIQLAIPKTQSPALAPSILSKKRDRESAEPDNTTAALDHSVLTDSATQEAPSSKRVRFETASRNIPTEQVSDIPPIATTTQPSNAEEGASPAIASRSVSTPTSSTAPGLGGEGEDSDDDDFEIPPLVMDSDTEDEEEEDEEVGEEGNAL